mgnify:CR=1 FL=1
MYGAGQNVIRRILPDVQLLHCEHNPSFMGQAPEPIQKNLQELEDDGEMFDSIEDIWPDYPDKDDFFFNEDEY